MSMYAFMVSAMVLHISCAAAESLLDAVATRNEQRVREALHQPGVDINARSLGETALMKAVQMGDGGLEILKMLLDAQADPNIKNQAGRTALMYAAMQGSHIAVNMLLNAQADPTIKDNEGKTALDYARERYNIKPFFKNSIINALTTAQARLR